MTCWPGRLSRVALAMLGCLLLDAAGPDRGHAESVAGKEAAGPVAIAGSVGQVSPFSPARFVPAGRAGLVALVSPGETESAETADLFPGPGGPELLAQKAALSGGGDCVTCHADIAAQWQGSAHHFASFNNPYYAAAVRAYRKDRSPEAAGFCAGCHDPLLLVDGAISRPFSEGGPAAQAGVVCLLCHSIASVHDRRGNGGYTVDLAPVPSPGGGSARRLSAHAHRLHPALLGQADLCAACHKVGLSEDVTHDRWFRGQDDYDAWEQGLAGGNGVAAVYRTGREKARRCQDCHMPLVPTSSGKLVRSHRFLAANSALPYLRGDAEAVEWTAAFLKDAVSLDLVVMTPGTAPAPSLDPVVAVSSLSPLTIDVVLRNRRVGHRFPGGTGDSNVAYVEVEARAEGSARVARDQSHLLRAQPVDGDGRPLFRRDVQHLRGVVYDTSLSPADPQVVRYRLDPADLGLAGQTGRVEVRARLRYRKFSAEYAAFACADLPQGGDAGQAAKRRCLDPPTVEISSAQRTLLLSPRTSAPEKEADRLPPGEGGPASRPLWERYLDHGLGLADGLADRASEALPSLLRARDLSPQRPEPMLGLARMYLALGRTNDVLRSCEAARDHPAALWLRGLALTRAYQGQAARAPLEQAARMLPGDRNLLLMLARVRGLAGDSPGVLSAADRLLAIDPDSADGHYQRFLALRELSRDREADVAETAYLRYRRLAERDQELRARFRALYPSLSDEDIPAHTHVLRP